MDRSEVWDWSKRVLSESDRGPAFRVTPLSLRVPVEELLRRRGKLFDSLSVVEERRGVWMVETSTTNPATSSRPERIIDARFLAIDVADGLAAFVSATDSFTYAHSLGRLESACYPLAERPFVPIEVSSRRFESRMNLNELSVQVMQIRGSGKGAKSTIQLFGRYGVAEAFEKIGKENAVAQSIRLSGTAEQGERVRVRIDTGCRLLVEKWRLDWSPLDSVNEFVALSIQSKRKYKVDLAFSETGNGAVALVAFKRANDATRFRQLMAGLRSQPGITVFELGQAFGSALKAIDILTGVSCTISPFGESHLAIQATGPIHSAFIERVKTLLDEIDQTGLGLAINV